jgi:hypothetical protein
MARRFIWLIFIQGFLSTTLYAQDPLISGQAIDISNEKEGSLFISPNPSCCLFSVLFRLDVTGPLSLKIFDATGKPVYAKSIRNFNGELKENIDMSSFAEGLYILQITVNKLVETRKLVVEY